MVKQVPKGDRLIELLNAKYERSRDICFSAATDPVVAGIDLEQTGNRSYGKDVYVSTGRRFEPKPDDLHTGVTITVGTREKYRRGELRCDRSGGAIVAAVYAPDGRRISRELSTPGSTAEAYDEGAFAWFGPVEYICTPWSDNDPAACQVITLDRLRIFATAHKVKKT